MVLLGAKYLYGEDEQFESGYFNLKMIKAATQNFSSANKIGQGYFVSVYKGVLPNGKAIAVKVLSSNSFQAGRREFQNEVDIIPTLRHPNLVRLLGSCAKNNQLLLVYEYMENGSLDTALFGPGNLKRKLNWRTRVKICLGIARGIAFLHYDEDESKVMKIVHRDINPSNVLLDKYLNPKISDFGLVRQFDGDTYKTAIGGTIGYIAPETLISGIITEKVDAYSFGVVTLELMSGRRILKIDEPNVDWIYLPNMAQVLQKNGEGLLPLIDEELKASVSPKEALVILDLAIWCVNDSPTLRPTMSEVVSILEGRTIMKTPIPLNDNNNAWNCNPFQLPFASKGDNDNSNTTFHGHLVSDARDSMGEGGEDDSLSMQENNATLEPLKLNSRLWASSMFVDAENTKDKEAHKTYEAGIFNLTWIKFATQNFSSTHKIGEGSSGSVYKGVLPNGMAVAVKKLSTKSEGRFEFLNEVNTIATMRHPNLLALLGWCTEDNQLLLVYEYIENGSLDKALFGPVNMKEKLTWPARVRICLGIAKGLAFLHEDNSKVKIVHRDIKPSNVLLDKNLNPKISDFGTVTHYKRETTHINIERAGTIGYMPPEYVIRGTVTEKVDVYSFGLVTLELMSGKRSIEWKTHENASLLDLAYDLKQKGDLLELIDHDLKKSISKKEATMMLDLALLCTSESPKLRPTMSKVVHILEGRTMTKNPPLNSPYLTRVYFGSAINDISNQSFGVVTLELIMSGRPFPQSIDSVFFRDVKENLLALLDEDLKTSISVKEAYMVIELARLCTNPTPTLRPTMSEVVNILEGTTIIKTPLNSTEMKVTHQGNVFGPDYVCSDNYRTASLSSHVASMEEQGNTASVFRGDLLAGVKDSTGEASQDVRLLIQANVATLEPPSFSAKLLSPCIFVDATKVEYRSKLEYIEPSFEEGKLHIECSNDEFETGCTEWKDSLVGYLVGGKPSFNVDKEMVEKLWGVEGRISVLPLENRHFLFRFDCVEDKIRVLESSDLWHIKQRALILREWDWKLKFDKAEMNSLPVWVKIYNLPLFLWSSSFFSKLGSGLGIPLYVDQKTKNRERLAYAKLCIEVDASKPLPASLNISVKGVDYELKLEYDWKPSMRAKYSSFRHIKSDLMPTHVSSKCLLLFCLMLIPLFWGYLQMKCRWQV